MPNSSSLSLSFRKDIIHDRANADLRFLDLENGTWIEMAT